MHFSFRTILKLIGAFFISLLLFLIVFLITTRATILNPSLISKNMIKTNYYDNIYYGLMNEYSSLSIPSNIPTEVFAKAITKNDVTIDVHNYFVSNFKGKPTHVDTVEIQNKLFTAFKEYSDSKNIILDNETTESLRELSAIAAQTYKNSVEFPFMNELSKAKNVVDKYLIAAIIMLCVLLIAIAATVWLFEKWKHRAVRYYSHSIVGCSLTGLVLSLYMLIFKPYKGLNIEPLVLSNLIADTLNSYFLILLITFLIVGILVLELLPIYKKLYKKVI